MLRKISLLDVGITVSPKDEVLEYILNKFPPEADSPLAKKVKNEKLKIYTPNPEILMYATKHADYKRILNTADIALPDGMGITRAASILKNESVKRIGGTDFMEYVCKEVANKPISIGLLGARTGVAEKAAECLREKYPGLNIVFAASEWPSGESDLESRSKKQEARSKKQENTFLNPDSLFSIPRIDLLFVAFGAPKQEEWIAENLDKLPVRVMMGVGGAFDYISGEVPRAPKTIRELGFEWLYRLIRQPWRWRRQIALIKFIYLVFREKFISR